MHTNNRKRFPNKQYTSKRKHIITTGIYNHYINDALNSSAYVLKEKSLFSQKGFRKRTLTPLPTTWVILLTGLLFTLFSYPATLVPLKVKCEQGQKDILLPIDLKVEPSERISGIQFDISIPSGTKITNMSVAESAQKANKMVSYNQIKSNTYRTIIAGLNQQSIPEGTLLFVNITIEDKTLMGKHLVKLSNAVLADPEGNSVNCIVLPGEILFSETVTLTESDTSKNTIAPSSKETTKFLDRKKIGILILITVITLSIGLIVKKVVKNKNSTLENKNRNKKRKK